MSANRSVDRSAVAHEKDRSYLCFFTFADGRRCSAPRLAGHPHLCCFHAKREARSLAAQQVGRDVSSFLSNSYVSACDLSSALACVFSAVAQGQVKPKTATTLAYLGQTLLQSIHIAQHEYINAFGTNSWREAVRSSFAPPPAPPESASQPVQPQPALESTLAKV
jgi:hypothetical protein